MRVLITGATGFIGGNFARELLKNGHIVSAIVRKTSNAESLRRAGAELIRADITDEESLGGIRRGDFDIAVHSAGLVDFKNYAGMRRVNAKGTENVCRMAAGIGVKKLVYISSVSVVSGNDSVPLSESLPYRASNIYGRSKLEAEKIAVGFRDRGLNTVILRPCMVYGEGEPHLLDKMLFLMKHRMLPLLGRGDAKWHLVYIGNLTAAMTLATEKDMLDGGTFFVADKEILTVREVFEIMCSGIGTRPPLRLPEWTARVFGTLPLVGDKFDFFLKDKVYDISRIESLGYRPPFRAQDALRRTAIKWLEARRGSKNQMTPSG